MNAAETERALTSLVPSIKKEGAETALLKYAHVKNLAPAQLEHLGRAYNKVLLIAHTKTAKTQAERGEDLDILDTAALVAKYTDSEEGLSASGSKSASIKAVPGNYRSFTVGDAFADPADVKAKKSSLGVWAEFDKADAERPDEVGTYQKMAADSPVTAEEVEFMLRGATDIQDAALGRWSSGVAKLAAMSVKAPDFVAIAQDATFLSPALGRKIASSIRTKLASSKKAWHAEVPEDTRDFYSDRFKIADQVAALEDAWFEYDACVKAAEEIKAAAKAPRGGSLRAKAKSSEDEPTPEKLIELAEKHHSETEAETEARRVAAEADTHEKAVERLLAGKEPDDELAPDLRPRTLGAYQEPEPNNIWMEPARAPVEPTSMAGLGSAAGQSVETAGTSLRGVMEAIAANNPQDKGMGAAKGLSALIADPRARAAEQLQSRVRTMRERSTLERLLLSDPVISKHNPAEVVEVFNTIRSAYPGAASDMNMARLLVRESLGYQGTPISTVSQLSSINKDQQPKPAKPNPSEAR